MTGRLRHPEEVFVFSALGVGGANRFPEGTGGWFWPGLAPQNHQGGQPPGTVVPGCEVPSRTGWQSATGPDHPGLWRKHVDRAGKEELVSTLNTTLAKTGVVVVAHYSGLTVAQLQKFRKELKTVGAEARVAKNRLVKIALEGTDVASIAPHLKGPTILIYSKDPVAAPKVTVDFAKAHEKLVILGGAMGKTALDANGVKALATMPSLDELRAKLLGLIVAPATKIAQLTTAPAAKLARVFGAYAKRDAA